MRDASILETARAIAHEFPTREAHEARARRSFEVTAVWAEGPRYLALRAAIDDADFLDSHAHPAQYTTLQYGSLPPRYLVIASPPTTAPPSWDFLVDRDTDLGEALAKVEPGHQVVLSPAEGSGYPIAPSPEHALLLFTTGSGVASMRPVIERARAAGLAHNITLYYGEQRCADFAWRAHFDAWRHDGVRLFLAAADAPAALGGYTYVQDAFDHDLPRLDDAHVLVSGAPVMIESVAARLLHAGVDQTRISTNI